MAHSKNSPILGASRLGGGTALPLPLVRAGGGVVRVRAGGSPLGKAIGKAVKA